MHKISPALSLAAALSLAGFNAVAATTAGSATTSGATTSGSATVAAPTSPGGAETSATTSPKGVLQDSPPLRPAPLSTPPSPSPAPAPAPDTAPPTSDETLPTGTKTPPDTSTLPPSNQTSGTVPANPATPPTVGTRPIPFDSGTGSVVTETGATQPAEDFVIGANGERIPVNRAASVLPAPANATPTLDAAMRNSTQQTRKKVARQGQLLHSITPRTNADKSDQMPDDPVSPALTR